MNLQPIHPLPPLPLTLHPAQQRRFGRVSLELGRECESRLAELVLVVRLAKSAFGLRLGFGGGGSGGGGLWVGLGWWWGCDGEEGVAS